MTDSMRKAIQETKRRRDIQEAFNLKHKITPRSIQKEIKIGIERFRAAEELVSEVVGESRAEHQTKNYLSFLKIRMESSARALEFDKAARYRDEIRRIEEEKGIQKSVLSPYPKKKK